MCRIFFFKHLHVFFWLLRANSTKRTLFFFINLIDFSIGITVGVYTQSNWVQCMIGKRSADYNFQKKKITAHRMCVVCRQENEWNVNDVNMGLNCPSFFWYAICTIFLHSLSSFHFFLNFQFWCCRCNSTALIAHAVTMSGFILQIDSINLLE